MALSHPVPAGPLHSEVGVVEYARLHGPAALRWADVVVVDVLYPEPGGGGAAKMSMCLAAKLCEVQREPAAPWRGSGARQSGLGAGSSQTLNQTRKPKT